MARPSNERRYVDDRSRCLAVLLVHTPVRTWRSPWILRCSECGGRWDTGGQLVGCRPVREATAELAGLNLPGAGRYERWWMR